MEQQLNNLSYRKIDKATEEIINYIDNRRKGLTRSLATRWQKFNKACMGGIEPNTIYCIAGVSGSGKSSIANSLESDLFECNPSDDFIVLSFNFEMLASRQVGRKLSYRLKKTTAELYSGLAEETLKLSDSDYEQVVEHAKIIKQYPIYYVDSPGTVNEVRNTIVDFIRNVSKDKWLIIFLDHTLLVKGLNNQEERMIISDLQRLFMELKKYGKTTIVQLSQMNREIEDKERINNNMLHYPVRRDIAGSDSVFRASDYVLVVHRPELLGIKNYGPKREPVENLVYMHILKAREGEQKILRFENNLKYNSIEEANFFDTKN